MRQETKGRSVAKYSLAAALVAGSAAALASFTFSICPNCNSQRLMPEDLMNKPKEPEQAPEPKPEASRNWTTTDS